MNNVITATQALAVLREAELLHSAESVDVALGRLAAAVEAQFRDSDPLLLAVMNGGMFPAVWLAARLSFPAQLGYVHATRYRGGTQGGELHWIAKPRLPVAERSVLVIDDIFDEGLTLQTIVAALRRGGARSVHTAVLVNKRHARKPADFQVDFVGLEVVDRYVFGCGMDYKEYWRHLPAIYAVKDA